MSPRESKIHEEACALWQALFGEPPPAGAEGSKLLELAATGLPAEGYVRLRSPFLRPSTIAGPNLPTRDEAPD